MKITFVLPTLDYTGGNRVVAMHAAGLIQRGHEVEVVVPPPAPQGLRASIGRWFPGLGGRKQVGGSHVEEAGLTPIVAARPGPVIADDVPDADVIVATWWETAEWVEALPPSKGAKAYFVQHHEVFDYTPKHRVEATYRSSRLHRIAVAQWLVDKLRDEYGDGSVDLVPNAVDHRVFHAPPRGKQARPTVAFMASSTPFKGAEVAFEVLAKLRARLPDLRIAAFGTEPLPPAQARSLDIDYVLAPAQPQVREVYAGCDVWLSTSHCEGFNLPALEAMACRAPVVSTATGWPAEAIAAGVNGFLAAPGDADTLATHVEQVLRMDEPRWSRMSAAAFATASQRTWPASTALFESALKRMIAREPPVLAA